MLWFTHTYRPPQLGWVSEQVLYGQWTRLSLFRRESGHARLASRLFICILLKRIYLARLRRKCRPLLARTHRSRRILRIADILSHRTAGYYLGVEWVCRSLCKEVGLVTMGSYSAGNTKRIPKKAHHNLFHYGVVEERCKSRGLSVNEIIYSFCIYGR